MPNDKYDVFVSGSHQILSETGLVGLSEYADAQLCVGNHRVAFCLGKNNY